MSAAVWYVVCEQRRLRLSLLVRWGALVVAVAALGTGALLRGEILSDGRTVVTCEFQSFTMEGEEEKN